MIRYYVWMGARSLRKNPVLSALMIVGIALGIAACMTSLSVFHAMGSDPIPWKSSQLHYVQLDNWDPNGAFTEPNEPPNQVTYRDAVALMEAGKADRQAAMFRVLMPLRPERREVKPFLAVGRATGADFFPMFEPPFRFGGPWSKSEDEQHARIAVLSRETNEKLFGGENSVGKRVRVKDVEYSVVGVLDEWRPRVKFYDVVGSAPFDDPEELYIPYSTAVEINLGTVGSNSCWQTVPAGRDAYLASECVWQQLWVQLGTPARLSEYTTFLNNYVEEQKKLGRFQRPLNNRLYDVNDWLANQKVVSRDVQIQVGLAFAFLGVCLVNTIGLLLAKFMRRSGEIGLRRALGASRLQIFAQHLIEAAVVGLSGGAIGLCLTGLGLWMIRRLDDGLKNVTHLDGPMIASAVALSLLAALLAGLYPTWRACRVPPALHLKTQ
ncbi:MAG: ABC transporter permease [Tahibacter sp.]